MDQRLQKILSAGGVCSRRKAEEYLREGRVTVNGVPAALGDKADPETDTIALDGVPVGRTETRTLLMLYKPRGVVTTLADEKGRRTVADLVKDCGARVWPVGRLDLDSEGLLLLTDDGALTNALLHPSQEVEKEYLVWVKGYRTGAEKGLERPMTLDGQALRHHPRGEKPLGPPDVRPLRTHRDPPQAGAGGKAPPGPGPGPRPVAPPDGGGDGAAGAGNLCARLRIFSCKMGKAAL